MSFDVQHQQKNSFVLYYWPLKNRGNFIRLCFAEANCPFEDIYEGNEICKYAQFQGKNGNTDTFAPPIVRHNDDFISQTVCVVQYISEVLGLRPKDQFDHARAGTVVANAIDAIYELPNHKNDDKEQLELFMNSRFQIWLNVLEKPLLNKKEKYLYYFDNRVTQADLAVFNFMDGIMDTLGEKSFKKYVSDKHETLFKHYHLIGQRENIKKLIDKQKKDVTGNGFLKISNWIQLKTF